MEQTSTQKNSETQRHSFGVPPINLERTFHASVDALWKAWSDPQLVKQWWGPAQYTCPTAKIDFRVGGKNLMAMKDEKGNLVWSTGTYLEIIPNEKFVCTDQFCDENGNIVSAKDLGMPGDWPETLYVTVKLEDLGNRTKMSLTHEGIPKEMHNDCTTGWNESIDKLQRLIEKQ